MGNSLLWHAFARTKRIPYKKKTKINRKKKNRSFRRGGVSFAHSVVSAHRGNDLCLYTYDALNKAQFHKIRQAGNVSLLFFISRPVQGMPRMTTETLVVTLLDGAERMQAQLIKKQSKDGDAQFCAVLRKKQQHVKCRESGQKREYSWFQVFNCQTIRSFMVRH